MVLLFAVMAVRLVRYATVVRNSSHKDVGVLHAKCIARAFPSGFDTGIQHVCCVQKYRVQWSGD